MYPGKHPSVAHELARLSAAGASWMRLECYLYHAKQSAGTLVDCDVYAHRVRQSEAAREHNAALPIFTA